MNKKIICIGIISMLLLISASQVSSSTVNKKEEDSDDETSLLNEDITIHVYARNEKTGAPIYGVKIWLKQGKIPQDYEHKNTDSNGYCKFEGNYYCTYLHPIVVYNDFRSGESKFEQIQPNDLDNNNECNVYLYITKTSKTKPSVLFEQHKFFEKLNDLFPIFYKKTLRC